MAQTTSTTKVKRLSAVHVGDQVTTVRTVAEVLETKLGWLLTYDDGTQESFDRTLDPAIEVVG